MVESELTWHAYRLQPTETHLQASSLLTKNMEKDILKTLSPEIGSSQKDAYFLPPISTERTKIVS